MASRRLWPRWPRRTFPGGSEASLVFSSPSWCLFHHPTIRKAWTNEAKGGLWRRSAPWSRLFLGRKLGVPRNIPNLVFFIRNSLVPNLPCFNHLPKNTAERGKREKKKREKRKFFDCISRISFSVLLNQINIIDILVHHQVWYNRKFCYGGWVLVDYITAK